MVFQTFFIWRLLLAPDHQNNPEQDKDLYYIQKNIEEQLLTAPHDNSSRADFKI